MFHSNTFKLLSLILHCSVCFGQSKKEQIEAFNIKYDSLNRSTLVKDSIISVLKKENLDQVQLINSLSNKISHLSEEITGKNSEIKNLLLSQTCISARTETTIKTEEEVEPAIVKTTYWNGFVLELKQEGENETYPSRLYSFKCGIADVIAELPVGCLFNEKREILEKRLNELIKLELTSAGISSSQIIHYYFPVKDHDSGEGAIMLFIDHDIAKFYFEQYMYGVNDRREIEMPLSELNEYLIDLKDLNKEERRKYCSKFNTPILIQVLLKNVEEGDAGYYLEFVDPISGEIFPFSFVEWQFKDQMIEEFCEKYWRNGVALEKKFMLEFQWSKIKQYEYRGFEEGNVETGKTIDAWTLVSIYPGWTE